MIKVASYNIHKGIGLDRRRDPRRILEVLREIDADIIALQEADRRFGTKLCVIDHQLLADHSPWKAVAVGDRPASMGWHGNALLVRKDAQVLASNVIHLPALEPRGAVVADVDSGGALVRVVGMHLDLSGLRRRRQAHSIISHVHADQAGHPTVMMGDLNEWSAHAGCLRDFAHHFRFAATGPSFHVRRPVAALDRIMHTPDLRVLDCGVHSSACSRRASDHLPVWAVLESH
ncbi:MAG: endonuclease/exonuclease/phosphatase family protein [Pseudomonadota bacterium]